MHRPCEEALVVEDERCGPGTTRSGNGGEGQMMGGSDGGQMTGRQMTGHLAEETTAGTWSRHMAGGSGLMTHLQAQDRTLILMGGKAHTSRGGLGWFSC